MADAPGIQWSRGDIPREGRDETKGTVMTVRLFYVLGLVLVALTAASPVLAGPGPAGRPQQPDGWVRYQSFHSNFGTYKDPSPWKGDDIYNQTGQQQTAKQLAAGTYEPGDYYVFQVTIQGDGTVDSYHVHATGTGNWQVKYFHGKTNITSEVVAGTYETPVLDGTTWVLKVKVWIGNAGTSMERLLAISSTINPIQIDTVRIKASYTGCGC